MRCLARQIKAVGRQGLLLFLEYRLALMKAEEQFVAGLVRRIDMACKKTCGKQQKTGEYVVELGANIQKAIADKLIETFDDVVQQGVPDRFNALLKQLDDQNNDMVARSAAASDLRWATSRIMVAAVSWSAIDAVRSVEMS
jgi:hypothetical protein